jgi:beta-1,4-N-acetylglucosaminyltransferase
LLLLKWLTITYALYSNLVPAIEKSSEFRSKLAQFPPITSGTHRETKSVEAMMDETMGYLD